MGLSKHRFFAPRARSSVVCDLANDCRSQAYGRVCHKAGIEVILDVGLTTIYTAREWNGWPPFRSGMTTRTLLCRVRNTPRATAMTNTGTGNNVNIAPVSFCGLVLESRCAIWVCRPAYRRVPL